MRVLQINKFFYEKGGAERYLFSLCRSLESRGHAVVHFSMRHPENAPSRYSEYFVGQRDYNDRRAGLDDVAVGFSFIRSREAAKKLSRLIDDTRPDIAHLHNIYHQITPSIIPVLHRKSIPIVMTLHDHKLVCPNYTFYDGRDYCDRCRGGRFYQAPITRCNNGSFGRSLLLSVEAYWQRLTRVYDGVRFFLAPSRYMRDTFIAEGFGADRVIYLAPYVLDEEWNDDSRVPSKVLGDLPDKYIVYFGRLGGGKGLTTLLDAVARSSEVKLVMCGDGPLRGALESHAGACCAGNVTFTGHLSKPLLRRVVTGSTAVVIPSEGPENAPFAALEAMSLATPVIVSDRGGLPELAAVGGCLVFEAGNTDDLARAITELWCDGARARELGQKGKDAVTERFTEERHVTELIAVYQHAVGVAVTEGDVSREGA